MSASDAAPLPRLGEVFFDVRGNSRSMRLSWYADTGVAVFSIWQGGMCTGTFRLAIADLPRMVETLRRGPTGQDPAEGREAPGQQFTAAPMAATAEVSAQPNGYHTGPAEYPAEPAGYRTGAAEYPAADPAAHTGAGGEYPADYSPELPAYRSGPADYQPEPPSYPSGPADYQPEPASYPSGPADYQPEPASYRTGPADYQPEPPTYRTGPADYQPEPPTYRTGPADYQPEPPTYRTGPADYQPEPPTYRTGPADYGPETAGHRAESAPYPPPESGGQHSRRTDYQARTAKYPASHADYQSRAAAYPDEHMGSRGAREYQSGSPDYQAESEQQQGIDFLAELVGGRYRNSGDGRSSASLGHEAAYSGGTSAADYRDVVPAAHYSRESSATEYGEAPASTAADYRAHYGTEVTDGSPDGLPAESFRYGQPAGNRGATNRHAPPEAPFG